MTRYADPRRCPDCRAAIAPGAAACARCGLPLRGQTAQDLYLTLVRADELLATLRAVPVAAAPAPEPAPALVRPPHRLSAASVPKILLTLGAACLLVAALVFLAVTWQLLGVAGRTLVLVAFTGAAAALAAWSARRGLRAAAEALGLVALGLLVLDLVGGWHAGWFGGLDTTGLLVLLGAVLGGAAGLAALAVRRTPVAGLTGAEVVAAGGVALVAAGIIGGQGLEQAVEMVVATLVAAAAALAAHRLRLRVAAVGAAVVAGTSWLLLTGTAMERLGTYPTADELWLHLQVWPLLVSAALVAALAAIPALRLPVRVGAVAVGWGLLGLAALGAVLDERPTAVTLGVLAVVAVTAAASWPLPRRWRLSGVVVLVVGGLAATVLAGQLGAAAATRLAAAVAEPWTGSAATRLPPWGAGELPAAWVLPLAVLVVAASVLSVGHALPVGRLPRPAALTLAAGVAVATLVATLALYPVALWVPAAVLAVAGGVGAVVWDRSRHALVLGLAALALAGGTVVALVAEPLTAVLLAEVLAVAALVRLRSETADLAAGAGLALAVALGAEAWTVGALLAAPGPYVALAALVLLGAGCQLPVVGLGVEAGAAAVALPLAAAGVLTADPAREATWASVYLTVAGVAVVAQALLRGERRRLGWPGGALLALASWVRLADLGVTSPEAYTLPAAAALVAVGLAHLHRAPRASTLHALSAGLGLALVPSLLWVLADPEPLRALLLGVACFALVAAGVRVRWEAPLLWGAGVGLAEVLRLAAPYVGSAVPRWVLIGVAGAVLVAMGVTWERRLADARHVLGYVRALR